MWSWNRPLSQVVTHCLPLRRKDPPHAVHSKSFSQVAHDGWQAGRKRISDRGLGIQFVAAIVKHYAKAEQKKIVIEIVRVRVCTSAFKV